MRSERDADVRLTRRAVVGSGAILAGTGIGAVTGAASSGRPIAVTATEPYVGGVRALAGDVEREAGVAVEVRSAGGTDADRVLDGDADLFVSGRPVVDRSESVRAEGTATSDGAAADEVGLRGAASLEHPTGAWREGLDRDDVRRRWTADAPVETWTEATPAGVDGLNPLDDLAPGDDRQVLVRGTRPYQYAKGFGGEAYYAVADDALDATATQRDGTPLARVEYLHVAPEARDDAGIDAFREFYRHAVRRPTAADSGFVDPVVADLA